MCVVMGGAVVPDVGHHGGDGRIGHPARCGHVRVTRYGGGWPWSGCAVHNRSECGYILDSLLLWLSERYLNDGDVKECEYRL